MKQQSLFKVRDRRQRGWFYLDNEYLNGYARIFGAVGVAVYVSLCRHADNETQECFPSMELMSEELNVSRKTVSKYIRLFEENNLIAIERSKDERTKKWKNNTYWLLDKTEWKSHGKLLHMEESHGNVVPKPWVTEGKSHGNVVPNKETHINYTHTTILNETNGENVFIDLFKEINPTYQKLFANKTQRAAAKRLLQLHPLEWWERFLKAYKIELQNQFCPKATTPVKLEDKLGDILAYAASKKTKSNKVLAI